MGEETAVENNRLSDLQGLVTLTLNRVILHTVMHHSSTSTYTSNFIEIEETFCGRTDVRADGHLRPTLLGRLRVGVDLKSKHASVTKYTTTSNKPKKLKPGLVASYNLRPGNGMGLFWKK